eukprot:Clim_evm35s128 gene=Clim_evmTU35s128
MAGMARDSLATLQAAIKSDFDFVQEVGQVYEFTMKSNGMQVLIAPDHSAPVVTVLVTYHVGSRNEALGYTGATHLLEHLMFKGTDKHNKEAGTSVWHVLQSMGAQVNATTWLDRTNYYELLPVQGLDKALAIEADRMRNAWIREEDRAPEMTVVRNEYEQGENSPVRVMEKHLWSTAYTAHPYHHPTIGWRSDIENVSIERLKEFYHTFYHPNNATVTLVGDVDIGQALSKIQDYFGPLPKSPKPIPVMYTTEPPQEGPRMVTVKRPLGVNYYVVSFKTPIGTSADWPSLNILGKILTAGKKSRLYKSLVHTELATSVFVVDSPHRDAGLFSIYVHLSQGTDWKKVEPIVWEELTKIKENGVEKDEVDEPIGSIVAQLAYARDGTYSVASNLNEAIATGDWRLYASYESAIRGVTPNTVQNVCITYFNEDQSTTGILKDEKSHADPTEIDPGKGHQTYAEKNKLNSPFPISPLSGKKPEGGDIFSFDNLKAELQEMKQTSDLDAETVVSLEAAENMVKRMERLKAQRERINTSGKSVSQRIKRVEPLPGLVLRMLTTAVADVVTITGSLPGGTSFCRGKNLLIAKAMSRLLDHGTIHRDKFEISTILQRIGAQISFSADDIHLNFSARCLRENFVQVMGLLAEQLQEPLFAQEELQNVQKQMVTSYRRMDQSVEVRSKVALRQALYPKGHLNYYISNSEKIDLIEQVTVEDIRAFHKRVMGLGEVNIVCVGDIDEDIVQDTVARSFSKLGPSDCRLDPMLDASAALGYRPLVDVPKQTLVDLDDKKSITLRMGLAVPMDLNHPDYLPLYMGMYILGGNFSARLMQTVRDEKGLTYGITASMEGVAFKQHGYVYISGSFAPSLLQKGNDAIIEQIHLWMRDITEDELETKKSTMIGSYEVRLATTRGLAGQIIFNAELNRPESWLDEHVKRIGSITLDRVKAAITKYVTPANFAIAAAGPLGDAENLRLGVNDSNL